MSESAQAPVVTVDGPSGSGKGTVARRLAETLGWHFLDSGALYRLTAVSALKKHVDLEDESALAELARSLDVEFGTNEEGGERILLEGEDVTREIRTEKTGNAASKVAARNAVRDALLERQRDFRQAPGLVADGRDMGTVVFPRADLKIFLTASAEERARRRYKQLKEQGAGVNLEDLISDIRERDQRDAQRAVSPLVPAPDAVEIDSSRLSADQVFEQVLDLVKRNVQA